jgi:hypothetical protein
MVTITRVEVPLPMKNTVRRRLGIEDFRRLEASTVESFSEYFRFRSCDQLRRLVIGFQFPDIIRIRRAKFSGKELLLITLVWLSYPLRWADMLRIFPGRDRQDLQRTFYWTLDHLIVDSTSNKNCNKNTKIATKLYRVISQQINHG